MTLANFQFQFYEAFFDLKLKELRAICAGSEHYYLVERDQAIKIVFELGNRPTGDYVSRLRGFLVQEIIDNAFQEYTNNRE